MFNFQLIMISALTPVAVLIWYLYRKDKANPEPPLNLVLAFGAGVLSVFLSLAVTTPMSFMGIDFSESESMIGQALEALMFAAVPEEMAKLLMFLIVIHFMKNFDEYFDGAVYCGIVGWFDRNKSCLFYLLVIAVPVFFHWMYDALLMCAGVAPEGIDLLLMLFFFAFFAMMMLLTFFAIRHLLKLDKARDIKTNVV